MAPVKTVFISGDEDFLAEPPTRLPTDGSLTAQPSAKEGGPRVVNEDCFLVAQSFLDQVLFFFLTILS